MAISGFGKGVSLLAFPQDGAVGEVLTVTSPAPNFDFDWLPGGGVGPAATDWLEFVAQAVNPGSVPSVTLYMDDGSNFDVNTVAMGDLTIPMMLTENVGFGNPGTEQGGINVNGTTYDAVVKVNSFGGALDASLILHRHSTSFPANLTFARTNDDTAAHTAVVLGQTLGSLIYTGWTGSHYDIGAVVDARVAPVGTISPTSLPTEIAFFTTPDGSDAGLLALILGSDQILYGSTVISGRLDLQGSQHANRGQIFTHGRVELDYDWTTDAGSNALTWAQTIPASGGVVAFMISMANTVTVNSGTFIPGAIRDTSAMEWTVAPGFAVVTLFLSQPRLFSTTAAVAPAQTFVFSAQPTYESFGAGAITSTGFRAVSSALILRARLAGDNMTVGTNHGLTFTGLWNTNNLTAIVDFGNSAAVKVINPQAVLFGQSLGTERCVNWYGIDYDNITLATTGERAVVHSSLVASGINFFLKNDGGADSEHGSGELHFNDDVGVTFGNTLAVPDIAIGWTATNNTLRFDPNSGADMEFGFDTTGGQDSYIFDAENFPGPVATPTQIRFGFDRFAFGQTSVIGNQVGVFVAGTREVGVAGGWADYLLTQGGSLDIQAFAMSDVSAWVINLISLAAATGSITDLSTFVVGGMTTSNPGITVTERHALRITGRSKFRGSLQYQPIVPAVLSAGNNDDWAGLLTGSPNNNTRYWARISGNASGSDITGIDATAVQDGDTFELTNVSANTIRLMHQDTNSTAANRIINQNGNNFVLKPDGTAVIRYDSTTARWRVATQPGAVLPLESEYRFDSSTTMADPGSGDFRNNNATLASVTSIAISDISFKGGDASNILAALASGDQLYIQNKSAGDQFMVFDITGTTDNTTWWQIDGTVNSSGTAFSSNATFGIVFIFA